MIFTHWENTWRIWIRVTLAVSLTHDFKTPNHQLWNIKNDYYRRDYLRSSQKVKVEQESLTVRPTAVFSTAKRKQTPVESRSQGVRIK